MSVTSRHREIGTLSVKFELNILASDVSRCIHLSTFYVSIFIAVFFYILIGVILFGKYICCMIPDVSLLWKTRKISAVSIHFLLNKLFSLSIKFILSRNDARTCYIERLMNCVYCFEKDPFIIHLIILIPICFPSLLLRIFYSLFSKFLI